MSARGRWFWVLQQMSSLIISDYLRYTESTYGTFATRDYLALVVALAKHHHPGGCAAQRGAQSTVASPGLVDLAATDADYRAYQACAQERSYHDQEQVYADFPPPATVVRSPVVEPRSGAAGAGHAVPTALSHRRAHSPRTICLAGRYRAARGGPARRYGWWTRVTALL
jgi:hypothetical protein